MDSLVPRVIGFGIDEGDRSIDNAALASEIGCSIDDVAGFGVDRRHRAARGEGPSDLACRAAKKALSAAGLEAGEIDLIIFATLRPDVMFPGSACYLQDKLGARTIGALDVRGQCTGFLTGWEIATHFLRAGMHRKILLAAADVHTSGLDYSPTGLPLTALLGDGAAALVLDAEGDDDVLSTTVRMDGTGFDAFWCELPACRRRPRITREQIRAGKHHFLVDPDRIRQIGTERLPQAVDEALESAGVGRDDIARFYVSHLYPEVEDAVVESLGVADRAPTGRREGTVVSGSLPMAFLRDLESGVVEAGQMVCLASAGSGASWGASVTRAPGAGR